MKCVKCKKQIEDKSKFCNYCGTKQTNQQYKRRADGYYQKRIVLPNGKAKVFYGKTEKEIDDKILNYNITAEKKENEKYTFRSIATNWEREVYDGLAYSSYKVYSPRIKKAVEYFDEISIKDIDVIAINSYLRTLPKSYAHKTMVGYLSVVSMVFDFACRNGLISYNPCKYASLPKGRQKSHRRAPTSQEINVINNSLDADGGIIAFFFLYTGLRRGEALALTWGDIDFNNHYIDINKSVYWIGNTPCIKSPKTEKGYRKALLLDCLADILLPLKRKNTELVFSDNGNLYTNKRFASLWKKYQNITGLSLTPHMLRHGFATLCYDAKLDTKIVQDIVGHAQYSTTADIYTHINADHKQSALHQLNAHINKKIVHT